MYKVSSRDLDVYIPKIIRVMKKHGRNNPIKSKDVCELFQAQGFAIRDPAFRKCIKHIQAQGLLKFIVASECGFYYTKSISHIQMQIDSLKSREDSIKIVRKSLEAQLKTLTTK
jgi:hypothetical protein